MKFIVFTECDKTVDIGRKCTEITTEHSTQLVPNLLVLEKTLFF